MNAALEKKSQYKIGRDEEGLTRQERKVAKLITSPPSFAMVGAAAGMTKQRAYQITKQLVAKGVLIKTGDRYEMADKNASLDA